MGSRQRWSIAVVVLREFIIGARKIALHFIDVWQGRILSFKGCERKRTLFLKLI